MGSKIEYVDSSHMAASHYVRNSKAIGVLWAIFSICYAVISTVALLTPEWIGSGGGRAGVWQVCVGAEACSGRLEDAAWWDGLMPRLATALVALAALLSVLTLLAMLLFFFCRSTTVFHICGWLHLLSAASMLSGASVYPVAWGEPAARQICGPAADQFRLGECSIRWAYLLAGIACLDAAILSTLAFILATRHIRLHPDSPYNNPSLYIGEHNNAFVSDAGSARKTLSLQPAHMSNRDDTYSQYSRHQPVPHYRL